VRRSLAVVIALAVTGCGSGSESARQFRQAATGICRPAARRGAGVKAPTAPPGVTAFLNRGVAVFTPELRQLRRLRPPRTLQTDYVKAIGSLADELAALRSAVSQLKGGADPIETTQALQHRLTPIEARGDDAWRRLELPACLSR
jgi:hypothetical protein